MSDSKLQTLTQFFFVPQNEVVTNPTARLFAVSGPLYGQDYSIVDTLSIGRYPSNSIALENPAISKFHCKITRNQDNSYFLEDLHSKNGTFLNHQEIKTGEAIELTHGDSISICDSTFFFLNPQVCCEGEETNQIHVDFQSAINEAQEALQNNGFLMDIKKRRQKRSTD